MVQYCLTKIKNEIILYRLNKAYAPLAQLDRAFGYGPKGQEFESLTARQIGLV